MIVDVNEASSTAPELWNSIVQRHDQLGHDRQRPILDPAEIFLAPDEFRACCDALPRVHLRSFEWPAPQDAGEAIPVQNFASTAPATVRIDARADEPAAALAAHLTAGDARVLIAAESAGRRELLLELLRARGLSPRVYAGFARASSPATQKLGIAVVRGGERAAPAEPAARDPRPRRSCSATARARSGGGGAPTADPAKILARTDGPAHRRAGRARDLRRRPLRGPAAHGHRRPERRIPGARIRRRRPALRAGARAAPGHPLHRRARRDRAAAQARQRPVAEGAAQGRAARPRRRRRTARPATPGAPRARARRSSPPRPSTTPSKRLSVRGDRRPGEAIRQVLADMRVRQADGPGRLRGRRLRQDRGGDARRVRRRAGRQAGRDAGADDAAGAAALHELHATASPTGRCASKACRASARSKEAARCSRASPRDRSTS